MSLSLSFRLLLAKESVYEILTFKYSHGRFSCDFINSSKFYGASEISVFNCPVSTDLSLNRSF